MTRPYKNYHVYIMCMLLDIIREIESKFIAFNYISFHQTRHE